MAIVRSGGLLALAALPLLAAPSAAASQGPPNLIRFESKGCFFYCPVFVVIVDRQGRGVFQGRRHTEVQGTRGFRMTPAQFTAFEARLAPLRPASGSIRYDFDNRCNGAGSPVTDGKTTEVSWDEGGRTQSLHFYDGCPQHSVDRALHEALVLLPIKTFIGETCAQGRCR